MTSDPKETVMLAKASIQRHRNLFKNNKHGSWPPAYAGAGSARMTTWVASVRFFHKLSG